MNNPKNVNNQRNPNNGGTLNKKGAPPIIHFIPKKHVYNVEVSFTTKLSSNIRKPPPSGIFELKQIIVQILHSNGQFTCVRHKDPQFHLRTFLDITDKCIPLENYRIM